ncbi:MAG TPA: hypothetical protein VGE93_26520, partial [Bryobacteraceae bacterium]
MLNDHAAEPRYIETVPRRGYKFVAQVTELTPPAGAPLATAGSKAAPNRYRRVAIMIPTSVVACVLLGTAAKLMLVHSSRTPEELIAPRIIVSDALAPALSKDGKLLAYVSRVGGDVPHIWVRQTGEPRALQVTSGSSRDADPDFSPDGTHIAFWSERERPGVYVVPAFGGDARLVVLDAYCPRFSPDGKQILCIGADKRLRLITFDDMERGRVNEIGPDFEVDGAFLWADLEHEFHTQGPPVWSSSGTEVMFLGRRRNEPVTANNWWTLSVSEGASKPVAIPAVKRDHHVQPRICAWQRTGNGETLVLYSVQGADVWTLFRLTVRTGHVAGEPKQVASGSGFLGQVTNIADDGTFGYVVHTANEQIFEIPVDAQGARRGPVLELPLTEGARYFSPSASRDGRRIAYTEEAIGRHNIVVKDFATAAVRVLDEQPQTGFHAVSISPDGAKVVFNRRCSCSTSVVDCPSFLLSSNGGQAQEICRACTPRGFSSDGSFVLMQHYSGGGLNDSITAVDLANKRERQFLKSSSGELYHAFLSWDDQWVVFKKLLGTTQARILVAPVRNGQAGTESEWTAVTDGRFA